MASGKAGAVHRFPVDLDQLDEAVDAEVGESHDALVFEPLDPDYAVFRLHFDGDVEEEVDVFAEFLGHPVDGSICPAFR